MCRSILLHRLYRALYILNWIFRYMTEAHYIQWIGEIQCMHRGRMMHAP